MDISLFLVIATGLVGLVGLTLLSFEWWYPLMDDRRKTRLYATERQLKHLMVRGAPAAQEAVAAGIVPFAQSLEMMSPADVIATLEQAKLTPTELGALGRSVARSRPIERRWRTAMPKTLPDIAGELRNLLFVANVPGAFPKQRRYGHSIAGTVLTAIAIVLPFPAYLISSAQQQQDHATISRLVGEVLPTASTETLMSILSTTPSSVSIVVVPLIDEGYARQLRGIFEASGWHVTMEQAIFSASDPPVAIVLDLVDKADLAHVTSALDAAAITYVTHSDVGATTVQEVELSLPEQI